MGRVMIEVYLFILKLKAEEEYMNYSYLPRNTGPTKEENFQ